MAIIDPIAGIGEEMLYLQTVFAPSLPSSSTFEISNPYKSKITVFTGFKAFIL